MVKQTNCKHCMVEVCVGNIAFTESFLGFSFQYCEFLDFNLSKPKEVNIKGYVIDKSL